MSNQPLIEVDGRLGEGGGQVLRASLALSMALGKPFKVKNIRANRPKPGLKRQHLACVKAAQEICGAQVEGADINSQELLFVPGPVSPGDYRFDIGSGGSCCLVLQAILPPLLIASGPSKLMVTGGTHVPMAPSFEFFQRTLLPRLEKMGPKMKAQLERPGFMQVGGGVVKVEIEPSVTLAPFNECDLGDFIGLTGRICSYSLDKSIGERDAKALESGKLKALKSLQVEHHSRSDTGPGNTVTLELEHSTGVTTTCGIAQKGLPAEKVARQAIDRLLKFINARVPIDVYLADQLIVPLALAGGGRFITEKPSLHTTTVMELLSIFTNIKATAVQQESKSWLIEIN